MEWIEIFDISLLRSLLRSTAPIAIVGMAAAICSAAGVLNIGLEGKMLNAAFAGVAASYYTESMWAGLVSCRSHSRNYDSSFVWLTFIYTRCR